MANYFQFSSATSKSRGPSRLSSTTHTPFNPVHKAMSINTEFDFWPEERLAALVSCLAKSREGKPLPPKADERDHLPSAPAILPPLALGKHGRF